MFMALVFIEVEFCVQSHILEKMKITLFKVDRLPI